MSASLEIQMIAVLVSAACSLAGVFLVLRRMSMMSDSITHTILLGIVLAFFVTHDLNSPLLIVGATAIGVVTVWLTETLSKTRLVSEDSSIGIVFPLLFSIAIILITRYAGSVHLDTDSVLLGELAFAPFSRMVVFGHDIGAKSIYTAAVLLIINLSLIILFFKELKLATFDAMLASVLGFSPILIHYGLMTIVSFTAVGAFEAVGSVLVVAFMIGPPVTAYLLTDNLKTMFILSGSIGALSAIIGYHLAVLLDVSIAGSMAVVIGVIAALVLIFAPNRGLINVMIRKKRQRIEFAQYTFLTHIKNHEGKSEEVTENGIFTVSEHIGWENKKMMKVVNHLLSDGRIKVIDGIISTTEKGKYDHDKFMTELN